MKTIKQNNTKPRPKKKNSPPLAPSLKDEARWQAENDARTLLQAEEIKLNKTRLGKAKKIVTEQMRAAAKISKI